MKPFRLSKFMTMPPADERKHLKSVEANNVAYESEALRKSRVKHQKVKTGCYTCKYATFSYYITISYSVSTMS